MKASSPRIPALIVLLMALLVSPASEASLQSGVPFATYLEALTYANVDLHVPAGATRLTVSVTNGSGDLDLYLKYGRPAQGGTLAELDADADARSDGPTAGETIVLTPQTVPPLREGVWYIATLNLNGTRTPFTLTAVVEIAPSPPQALPVPAGQHSWEYPPAAEAVKEYDAAASKPMSVGSVASGGDLVTLRVETRPFAGPVDIYLGLHAKPLDPANVYLVTENNSLGLLSAGLRPWRAGVSAPVSETLCADVSAVHLPPGTYDLYLLVTPAGRRDNYYLWKTTFFVKPGPLNVPDGTVAFFDNTLVAPGAQIQYGGQSYAATAPVPPDTLVGVIKDGTPYLYHTALGNVPLSRETTRRAVGKFVMGPSGGASSAAASAPGLSRAAAGTDLLELNKPAALKTGVTFTRQASKVVDASNDTYRWAAVKGTDGTGPHFLQPVERYIDNNILRLIGTGLKLSDTWFNASGSNKDTISLNSDTLTLETYGAAWRPLPYFLGGFTDVAGTVASWLGYGKSPAVSIPIDGLALREEKDPALSEALDQLDFTFMVLEGVKSFVAAFDITETPELLVNMACNVSMAVYHSWVNGEAGAPHALSSMRALVEDLLNDAPSAVSVPLTGGGSTPFLTLMDSLAALDYIVEGVLGHEVDVIGRWAYDEIGVRPTDAPVGDYLLTGYWKFYRSCDETSVHCYPWNKNLKFNANGVYDELNYARDKVEGHGTWTFDGRTLVLTPTTSHDCTKYYQGTVTVTYQQDRPIIDFKGFSILGPSCANPGTKDYWWITR